MTDLFGVAGRELLDRLEVPQPWRGTIDASLELIDDLQRQIAQINTTKAALCAASTMLTAHPTGEHAITGVLPALRATTHVEGKAIGLSRHG